jgi:hypothetical protein
MKQKRTAAIVIGGGLLAAWIVGATTSNRDTTEPIVFTPSPMDMQGATLANEIARLHERLRPAATPRQPGRNLFAFRAAPAPVAPPVAPPAVLTERPPAIPAEPALRLVGVAEDPGPDGPVRTAIISGNGQLFLAKEGDQVTPRYQVLRVSAEVVELIDVGDGSSRRLAMK